MARAIERIERELLVLQEAIQAIARELQSAYASYLVALGQALRKQLILASYHLCTQGYPDNFLKLSLNQRQQLQQGLRKLGRKAAEVLISHLINGEHQEVEKDEQDIEDTATSHHLEGEDTQEETQFDLSSSSSEPSDNSAPQPDVFEISNPIELAKWQQRLEIETQQTLRKISHEANLILQTAGILPQKLPEPVLEAAAVASEGAAEMMPGPPNILNLVLEIQDEQDNETPSLTQIMTINLRLGEIEFADTTLANHRKQIREILGQLNKLGREYQKKQRERSIAEAEAAWRASWYED